MATLRVMHLIQCLHGYGAERQVRELLRCLQGDGLTVAVATIYPSGISREELAGLPFPTIDLGRRGRTDYSFLPRLVKVIREFSPDIVHAHTHSGKYWGRIGAWMAGVKNVVYTEHNPCDPARGLLARAIDPVLHAFTTRIVTFSSQQRSVLVHQQAAPFERVAIIPNGLPACAKANENVRREARALLGIDCSRYAVLLIGRFTPQKNQALALRALAQMCARDREGLVLFFIGSGSDEMALRTLARSLGVENSVRFLGYRNDVQRLLPGGDLLLSTSVYEGMPLTLIEAMAAGVPIVSTPWTGASEMLSDGRYGFLVRGWEPSKVAEEILRALSHAGTRASMAARAYAYGAEAFDIRRTAEEHRRLYRQICASSMA